MTPAHGAALRGRPRFEVSDSRSRGPDAEGALAVISPSKWVQGHISSLNRINRPLNSGRAYFRRVRWRQRSLSSTHDRWVARQHGGRPSSMPVGHPRRKYGSSPIFGRSGREARRDGFSLTGRTADLKSRLSEDVAGRLAQLVAPTEGHCRRHTLILTAPEPTKGAALRCLRKPATRLASRRRLPWTADPCGPTAARSVGRYR